MCRSFGRRRHGREPVRDLPASSKMIQSGRRLESPQTQRLFVLDRSPFDCGLVGGDCKCGLTPEPVVDLLTGNTVANSEMYDYALAFVGACPFPSRESCAVGQLLACHHWHKLSRTAACTCQSFSASGSINRTSPDTPRRHGAFAELGRRFS
jgi:hypothetical protein